MARSWCRRIWFYVCPFLIPERLCRLSPRVQAAADEVGFNIGMHHAPSTGDLPTTTFTSANGGVRIEPMNYFLNNPGKRTRQMVRVGVDGAGKLNVTTFGAQEMGRCSVRIIGTTEGWSL